MSRHKKRGGLWHLLAEVLSEPPKQQAKPQKPEPEVEVMRTPEDWCAEFVQQLEAAHDADSFQVAATTVYSMIRYEPDNDYVMTMYLPDIILSLGEKAGDLGEARPQDQGRLMWCMDEITTLVQTHYNPPPEVREVLDVIGIQYADLWPEEMPEMDIAEEQEPPVEAPAPTHWTQRPPGLHKASEIIAWHVLHGVRMPPFGNSHQDVLDQARSEGRW